MCKNKMRVKHIENNPDFESMDYAYAEFTLIFTFQLFMLWRSLFSRVKVNHRRFFFLHVEIGMGLVKTRLEKSFI